MKSAAGFSLPVIGLGTWLMGGKTQHDLANNDLADITGISAALTRGITHFDTAETYANGYAEKLLGQALRETDRSRLCIASKVLPKHLSYDDVIRSCKASVERLGVEYVDLYLIHRYNPAFPIADTLRAFGFLYEEGLIRYIGVSNFTIEQLEEAVAVTPYPIVNHQLHFSLSARWHQEHGTLDWCAKNNILVTAYRPLGFGKPGRGEVSAPVLFEIAEKYHKTVAQVALNWVLAQPNVVTLIKTSNPVHLDENLGALGWELLAEDLHRLDQEFPRGETIWGPAIDE